MADREDSTVLRSKLMKYDDSGKLSNYQRIYLTVKCCKNILHCNLRHCILSAYRSNISHISMVSYISIVSHTAKHPCQNSQA